jgi:quercetin 2,3-dioxygenase
MRAGEVAWIGLDDAERDREVKIATVEGSHIVCYASPPIDEPVAMGGPFVMNTEEEIRQAYADLKNGVLVRQTP